MALWYDCGNGFAKASGFARKKNELDFYICCTGPSLSEVRSEDFKIPGVFTIGLNTTYPHIKPDLWVGMDKPDCYDPKIWWESFNKICRGSYSSEIFHGHELKNMPNTFFADVKKPKEESELFKLRGHDINFVWEKNTLAVALHIAVWMGARKIHLVGCDLGGTRDYYDGRVLTGEQRKHNQNLYLYQRKYLRRFHENAKEYGIELISCSEQSPINNKVPFINVHEALLKSRNKTPSINSKIVHVLETEKPKEKIVAEKKQEAQILNPKDKLRVFVGASEQEGVPTKVLESSIKRRATFPVGVYSLGDVMKKKGIEVPVPIDPKNRPKTNFSFHRWCIPEICDYKGKAVYCDSDQVVLEDIEELLLMFDKYPDKSVIIMSDSQPFYETSVMLIDCEKVKWDIKDIVKRLDSGELTYKSLMFKMSLVNREEYIVGAEKQWNSLDQYNEKKTKLLHFTNRSTQPYKGGKSPLTHIWMEELKVAKQIGYVSSKEIKKAVAKNWISKNCLEVL